MQVEGHILLSQDIPNTNKPTGDMQYIYIFQLSQLFYVNGLYDKQNVWTFGQRTFGQWTFGRQKFGWWTFGR